MKAILFIYLMFICYSGITQNEASIIYIQEVSPNMDSNYHLAKEKFQTLKNVDPINRYQFMMAALKNDDIKTFKKLSKVLIKKCGWNYSPLDTMPDRFNNPQMEMIYSKGMSLWLLSKSNRWYSKWLKNNPNGNVIQQSVKDLLLSDQKEMNALLTFINYESPDSISKVAEKRLYDLGVSNLGDLITLCQQFDVFPNNFEHGFNTFNLAGIIIWHNMKVKDLFNRTWEIVLPFYEKAYLEGKVDYSLFLDYDYLSAQHFGVQKYGFLGNNIPMYDPENYIERTRKYNFDPTILNYAP